MTWRIAAAGMALALIAGCLGVDTVDTPAPKPPPESATGKLNEPPSAVIGLHNATGAVTQVHFLGDDVVLTGAASTDPDGRIQHWLWKIFAYDADVAPAEIEGRDATLRPAEPGDYTVVLYVTDDRGATRAALTSFSVHRRAASDVRLLPAPALPLGALPPSANLTLPARDGTLALSLNVTFQAADGIRLRIEIHAPDGTVLNRTTGTRSPLWAVAVPNSTATGDYEALVWLEWGGMVPARLEFVAWHGYHV